MHDFRFRYLYDRAGESDCKLLVILVYEEIKNIKIRIGEPMRSSLVSIENLVIN